MGDRLNCITVLSLFFFSVFFQERGSQTQKPEQNRAGASSSSGLLSARVSGSLNQGPGGLLLSLRSGGKPILKGNVTEARK